MRRATMRETMTSAEPTRQTQPWQGFGKRVWGGGMLSSTTTGDAPHSDNTTTSGGQPLRGRKRVQHTARSTTASREPDFTALMAQMAQGDHSALTALYDATSALAYGLAWRILQDQSAAEDVIIEVYTQVYQQASHYEPSRGTPVTWLLTLTHSRALDRLRVESLRQRREAPLETGLPIPSSTPDPEASSIATELRQVVHTALAALSQGQRQVIELAYYSELSHSEIAAQLGQPLGTIKTRLRMAMIALRHLLRPLLAEE